MTPRTVAFLFAGMGDHYPGMGRGLYQQEPAFRDALDRCASLLAPDLGVDVRDVLYPADAPGPASPGGAGVDFRAMLRRAPQDTDTGAAADRLNHTHVAHAAMFVTEYALASLWMSRGVQPRAMIGHSLGEFVAATVAGVFHLEDALRLIAERSRLIARMPAGAMVALPLSERDTAPLLPADVVIAAANSPESSVVAGPLASIEELERSLTARAIAFRRLPVHYASHAPMMLDVATDVSAFLRPFALHPPTVPFLSNVTGTWITSAQATDPDYWARHVAVPVRFADGVLALMRSGPDILLDIGPGSTLGLFARQCASAAGLPEPVVVASMRHAYDRGIDADVFADAARRLHGDAPAPAAHEEASTTAQALIADIWRETLGLSEVGVHDDFFQVGGSSLTATRVLSRIREEFEVTLPLRLMFETRTVAQLAAAVEAEIIAEVSRLSDDEAARLL